MKLKLMQTPEVEPMVVQHLLRHLGEVLPCEVAEGGSFILHPAEFDPERGQYSAPTVLRRLEKSVREEESLLAVVGDDLFAPGLNFVFGEADRRGRCAIISLYRLRATYPGQELTTRLFRHRVLTEGVHEVGHLLGLAHCREPSCVMHFSNSLSETDRKKAEPCPECRALLPK
jgi:archaemetzincin